MSAWRHIPSKENISDILTRGASPSLLGPASIWQTGPQWLIKDVSEWPVTDVKMDNASIDEIKKFCVKKVSANYSTKIKKVTTSSGSNGQPDRCSLEDEGLDVLVSRCSTLDKLIRSVAYVLRWRLRGKSVRQEGDISVRGRPHKQDLVELSVVPEVSSSEHADAWAVLIYLEQRKRLLEKQVQRLVPVSIPVKLTNYDVTVQHIVVGGRMKNFPVKFSSNDNIPILPYDDLAKLVIEQYHGKYHKEVDTIVAHVRRDVWVIKARKIASSIDGKCLICLERRKKTAGQVMGDLPWFRSSSILPAWSVVNMDLFGPLVVRDDCVKKGPRIFKKVWGVIYTCSMTRGVYLDVSIDYSTEAVLHTVRRLLSCKGDVRMIISDFGSQLRAADKEMKEWRLSWNKQELIRFGANQGRGLEWKFIMPNSQHQNGAAEILIKMVKGVMKSFRKAMGSAKLSLNELNTMMAEVSNIVNERPIGLKPNLKTDPEFLSPNSLYLGRCSDRINAGPFHPKEMFSEDPKLADTRFLLVQSITSQFWKVWHKLYFPTLLIRQKWHNEKRNLQVGDVCLLKDANAFRGEWRYAKVSATFPDRRGCVRNVEVIVVPAQDGSIKYKPVKPNHLKRHVSNLIVIVPIEDQNKEQEVDGSNDDVEQVTVNYEEDLTVETKHDEKTVKEKYFEENSVDVDRTQLNVGNL